MQVSHRQHVRIIAMERGAPWDDSANDGAAAILLIAQQADEAAIEFVGRVRQRLDEAARRGISINSGVLAASWLPGAPDAHVRAALATAMLKRLDERCPADFTLLAREDVPALERREVMELATRLCDARTSDAQISVRFSAPPESDSALESGPRHAIPVPNGQNRGTGDLAS